jgi:hypothetical protein
MSIPRTSGTRRETPLACGFGRVTDETAAKTLPAMASADLHPGSLLSGMAYRFEEIGMVEENEVSRCPDKSVSRTST